MGWRKLFLPRRSSLSPGTGARARSAESEQAPQPSCLGVSSSVYLRHSHDEPFVEHAVTLNVSASGGLLSLSRDVMPSQELLMANTQTDEELRCRVARVTRTQAAPSWSASNSSAPPPVSGPSNSDRSSDVALAHHFTFGRNHNIYGGCSSFDLRRVELLRLRCAHGPRAGEDRRAR